MRARVVATLEGDGVACPPVARRTLAPGRRAIRRAVAGGGVVGRANRPGGERRASRPSWTRWSVSASANGIDTIFPSWDPYVYVLSKHRDRFAAMGVTIPVPGIETVLTALDKYRTVRAGEAVGMPCPETHLYESLEQAVDDRRAAAVSGRDQAALHVGRQGHGDCPRSRRSSCRRLPAIVDSHGAPMLQEYIPGGRRDSVQFVVGRDGAVLFAFHKKRQRTFRRTARFGTVSESASPDQRLRTTAALVARVGWWGAMGVETIHDPRDGRDKLMEINPRFPRQLWNRTELGINEPLMCLQVARGEAVTQCPRTRWACCL